MATESTEDGNGAVEAASEQRAAMTDDQACQVIGNYLVGGRRWSPSEDDALAQLGGRLGGHIDDIIARARQCGWDRE